MKGKSSFWRKFKAIAIAIGMTLLLTGCDDVINIPLNLTSELQEALRNRSAANVKVAQEFRDAGLMSEADYNLIATSVTTNTDNLLKKIVASDNGKTVQNLMKSITNWNTIADIKDSNYCWLDDKGVHHVTYADFNNLFITNYVAYYTGDENTGASSSGATVEEVITKANENLIINSPKGTIMPYVIIDKNAITNLNETFNFPIYVLNKDFNNKGLDEIIEAVKAGADNKDVGILDQYFYKLTYSDNNGVEHDVTFLDTTKPENQLVRDTRWNGTTNEVYVNDDNIVEKVLPYGVQTGGTYENSNPHCADHGEGNGDKSGGRSAVRNFGNTTNKLGYDMIVKSSGQGYDLMAVRLTEFNQDAIDKIKETFGLGDGRYFVCNNRIYLMEYPVGYVSGFKESEDRNRWESVIEKSDITINIRTGQLGKSSDFENGKTVAMSDEDPYYSLFGALSGMDEPMASFVMHGETGVTPENKDDIDPCNKPWDIRLGGVTHTDGKVGIPVSFGRIVLRDYLEATYAPGVVEGDSLIVLGRKLRLNSLEDNKQNVVAEFYDKEGNKLENSPKLYIQDFADIGGILDDTPQRVKYISGYQESLGDVSGDNGVESDSGGTEDGTEDESEDNTENESDSTGEIRQALSKVDSIPTKVVTEINTSTRFPGPLIGNSDSNEDDNKPWFYAMFVRANMFQTALFSGWVQNTDQEKNSTVWWNNWLTSHGYTYRINTDNLVNYLKGNYAYDLAKEGVIVLDLETIAKIQQEFNRDNNIAMGHGMRTVFMVFGYLLISYAVILLIAWNVDVNVDLGFNILEKLSFGKWIAIKDYDEMPYVTGDTNFIKFSELLISCIIIITVGLLLILVNIVDLILMLIQLFGGIAVYLSKIITGV